MPVLSILQKNVPNIHSRIHHTLDAHIVVYYIKINTAKTKGKDLILVNKDILNLEAIPDYDTLDHHITDNNPMREIMTAEHTKLHIKIKTTVDLAATPTPKAPAEVDPIQRTEKDPIHSTEIGHHLRAN